MEEEKIGGITLNWSKLLPNENAGVIEEEPPSIEVVPASKMQRLTESMSIDDDEGLSEEFRRMSDNDLKKTLERIRSHRTLALKDGGAKLKASIRRHEKELARRQSLGLQKDNSDGCKNFPTINRSNRINTDSCREGDPPSRLPSQSKFGECFLSKFHEKVDSRSGKAFGKEFSTLNRSQNFKMRPSGQFTPRDRQKRGLSPRETTFQSPGNHSGDIRKNEESNRDKEGRHFCDSSAYAKVRGLSPRETTSQKSSGNHSGDIRKNEESNREKEGRRLCDSSADGKVSGCFAKRLRPCLGRSSSKAQNEKAEHVVLVDLEELETMAISTEEDSSEEENLSTNAIIYYPSRDDSEAVEISYSDMKCLAPGKCLSSTIMNFYTRHLQSLISSPDRKSCGFHFFNTYFYKKLQDAVMSEGMEETSFAKFRRWWKGVSIFEKAYVLLPIHEDAHWSLVIICIPDEKDETGPILLHLDSLGLHSSEAVFSNIKRFLIEEWKTMKEDLEASLYIADEVWENLPQSIDTQVMEVPQQRNVYDCGLFVLNSMKKFIEEAPRRVSKKNIPLFGKRWFNPAEASSLRHEIKSLLKERFKKSQEEDTKS